MEPGWLFKSEQFRQSGNLLGALTRNLRLCTITNLLLLERISSGNSLEGAGRKCGSLELRSFSVESSALVKILGFDWMMVINKVVR